MPPIKSSSPEAQSKNIAELRHSGYPEKQAVAISYSVKRESGDSHEQERYDHEKRKYGK